MYINAKMIPGTIPGIQGSGGCEFNMIFLIYYKNHCKCYNVSPHPAQQKRKKLKYIKHRKQILINISNLNMKKKNLSCHFTEVTLYMQVIWEWNEDY
jgi:hypothetical protein